MTSGDPPKRGTAPVLPDAESFVTFRIIARNADVVLVKGIVEAHDGLAQVYAESGGELFISSPRGREAELKDLVDGLCRDNLCQLG